MRRIVVLSTAAILLASPAAASAATKTVDMGLPLNQQKRFQSLGTDVNDFFPHGVTVHAGDSVKFVPTGFHTVDVPARGKKPMPLLATGNAVTGSVDAAGAPFWFNGQPTVGFNPAVATATGLGKRFTYTGGKEIQSGLPLSEHPKPMTVKFRKAGTYTYYCNVHPGMKGTVRVLPRHRALPSARKTRKALKSQIAEALAVAKRVTRAPSQPNTVSVGLAGAHGVEFYGFMPDSLTVPVGSLVTFKMPVGSSEIHTASTGPGDPEKDPSSYLGKLAASLGSPAFDPAAVYPSDPPPNPAGVTPTSHGNGYWSSGVMDAIGSTPLPAANSVRFTAPGTYQFYCLIHPFMHATVTVQ